MSSKPCAFCGYPVYPMEQFHCLNKIWHKACFKCTECGMTLNLKTFVGFDKMPYCSAHGPVSKMIPTTVTETPEWRRAQRVSQIQSTKVFNAKEQYENELEEEEDVRIPRPQQNFVQPVPISSASGAERETIHRSSNSSSPVSNHSSNTGKNSGVKTEKIHGQGQRSSREGTERSSGILRNSGTPSPSAHAAVPVQTQEVQPKSGGAGNCYRAIYSHDANDLDEATFDEGDLIIDCTSVDQGWLTGTVQRTGQRGMVPANYVVYTYNN